MRTLQFDGTQFEYQWWNGQKLTGTVEAPMSWDLETERIRPYRELREGENEDDVAPDPLHVPRPALGMAYDGNLLVLIHPIKFPEFISKHKYIQWAGQNVQFDFWCVAKHYPASVLNDLWAIGDNNGWHDTMIMDMLLQLGTGKYRRAINTKASDKARMYPSNLGVLCEDLGCGSLSKEDPYRLRFGELLNLSQEQIDLHPESENFYSYALKDVIATWRVFVKQRVQGLTVMKRAGWDSRQKMTDKYEIRPDAVDKFGVLSESLQTKSSIVLAEMSRTPLRIDQEKRKTTEEEARDTYHKSLELMLELNPEIIKRYTSKKRKGEIRLTKKSKLPQFNQKELVATLEAEAVRLNIDIPLSTGKKKGTSTSAKAWCHLDKESPFIKAWSQLEQVAKLLEFLVALDAPEVYCRYNLLMLNGRTSGGAFKRKGVILIPSINIQQMPRESADHPERSVRQLFLPPLKHKWYSCDYGFVELRTLAAYCRAVYGFSKLGDAIEEHFHKGGADPHQRTAAMIAGLTLEEYFKLPKVEQKKLRQSAKAVNFGYPGGLGVKKFIEYAKVSYGADFTIKTAKAAKVAWLNLYPELKLHLGDRTEQATMWQTGRKLALSWLSKKRLTDYIRVGKEEREKFSNGEKEYIWDNLEMLAYGTKDEELIEDAEKRKLTPGLKDLLTYRACTLTGRVRNNVKYTDGANTPFSGLAADGAKVAMWDLMRNGFKLLAFVHDAFDVAIEPSKVMAQSRTIGKIMCDSMEMVIGQKIPVAVEGELGDYWK